MSRRAWLLFAAMGLVWGVPYLLIRVAVTGHITPGSLVFLRTAIGGLILVPLAAARGELKPVLARWPWVVAYTAVEIAVPWVLLSDAETRLSSSLTGLLVAAVPLIGAVIAMARRSDHRLGPVPLIGLLVGLAGVVAMLGLDVSGQDMRAAAEVGVVALCYAVGPLIVATRLQRTPSLGVVAASLGATAVAYAPVAAIQLPRALPAPQVVAAVAVLGLVCTALAFILFFALITAAGPVRALMITYVNPAVALVLGVWLLGEALTVGKLLGFALVLAGVVLATRPARAGAGVAQAQQEGGAAA